MRQFPILLILLIWALSINACDECSHIDDPPTTYIDYPLSFSLVQENPPAHFIKLSNNDDKGLYEPENIDFLNEDGISVKDSLFFIQDRDIIYQVNEETVRQNLIQNYEIVFSSDYTLPVTMEHLEFSGKCFSNYIGGINLIVQDESYTLGSDLTIYL
jgi:hypothetical protein